jgi:hypothetical protein
VLIPYGITPHVVGAQFSAGDDDNLVTPIVSPFTAGLAIWPFIGRGDLGTDLPYPAGSGSERMWQANFQFTFVPEPSVWALLSPGLLYVLLRCRISPFPADGKVTRSSLLQRQNGSHRRQ